MGKLSLIFLLASSLNDCFIIILLCSFCLLITSIQAFTPFWNLKMSENKENSNAGHHQDIPQSVASNGHPEKKNLHNGVHTDHEETPQNGDSQAPVNDNPSPLPPIAEPASPQSGEVSPPVLVSHVRPNQDPQFDEENYRMRMYAVETDKKVGEENVGGAGRVIDDFEHPAGKVVDQQHATSDSMNDSSRISNEFEKVDSKSKYAQQNEEDEEEEEEEGEVIIPSLKKNRLQILKRQESDDYSKPNRKLDSSENEIYKETDPLIKSYLSNSHSIKMKKDKQSLKTDVLDLDVEENDPVTKVGAKLAAMAYDFEVQFRPMITNLVDKFFDETRKMGGGGVVEPSLKLLLKNYKTIAEEIFRNGYNWSRLLVILMFTFEIFQRLYVAYTPNVAKNLISHIGAVFVNIGLTAWLLAHGGWKKSPEGVAEENSSSKTKNGPRKERRESKCACFFAEHTKSVAGAAVGAILAAGAAYYVFQRR